MLQQNQDKWMKQRDEEEDKKRGGIRVKCLKTTEQEEGSTHLKERFFYKEKIKELWAGGELPEKE